MKNKILVLTISLCLGCSLFAQDLKKIEGRVVDKLGKPISGAVVSLDNVSTIVYSDLDGKFEINIVPSEKSNLIVKSADNRKVKVALSDVDDEELNVVLDYKTQEVDLGFGISQTFEESTASVYRTNIDQLSKRSSMNLADALYGNVLGLTSLQKAGTAWETPASFSIRGLQTLTNNDILVVVDGFERPINTLTMEEVESVSVLKDAAAVALYGFKGVNGVLSVKTKRGKYNSREIFFSYDHAFTSQREKPEFADAYTYANALNEALVNDKKSPRYTANELAAFKSGAYPYYYPNVNWVDEIFRDNGASNIFNLGFRGGGKKMKYFTLLNLQNNSGFIANPNVNSEYNTQMKYSKANMRTNLDIELSPTTMLEVNMQGLLSEFSRPGLGSDNLMDKIYTVPSAAFPTKTQDGVWGGNATWAANMNPLALVQARGFSKGHDRALYADAKLTQQLNFITEGLSASARLGYDNYAAYWEGSISDYAYGSDVVDMTTGVPSDPVRYSGGTNSARNYDDKLDYQIRHYNLVGTIDYKKAFGKNKLESSFIYSIDKRIRNNVNNTYFRQNFALYNHFVHDSKYIADLALVVSGSNKLATNNKHAFSPTLSAAWVISNEDFMKDVKFVDFLKLRASAGIVHSDYIPAENFWSQTIDSNGGYNIGDNFGWAGGMQEGRLAVVDIKKERAIKYNFGIEAMLLKDFTLTADVYHQRRDNIFVEASGEISSILGIAAPYANAGVVNSHGVELGLNFEKKVSDFTFFAGGKFSFAKNEVKQKLEEPRAYDYLYRTGHGVDQLFGLQAVGFFVDEYDIANSPVQQFSNVKPGDIKYQDQNGDGLINEMDEVAIGYNTRIPEIYYSFDLGAEWKNFGVSASFQGVGNYSVMLDTKSIYRPLINNTTISNYYYENRWTPDTPFAKYPRLTTESNDNNFRNNTVWLADASFLKLRNVELYYNLQKSLLDKLKLKNAKVYVRGIDLVSFDKLDVSDPESIGVAFPLTRSVNVGFSFGF